MTCSWPTCCCATAGGRHDAAPVLTDLHVHLRPDGLRPSPATLRWRRGRRQDGAPERRAPPEASGATGARDEHADDRHRLGQPPLRAGPPARPRRRRRAPRPRAGRPLRRRRPDPRRHRRAPGRGGPGRHRPALPRHRRALARRRLARAAARPSWSAWRAAGHRVAHVDTTVVLERPKLAPHRDAIRARLADGLGVDPAHVNVKATTGEGMGFVGREEGVAALAVATLVPRPRADARRRAAGPVRGALRRRGAARARGAAHDALPHPARGRRRPARARARDAGRRGRPRRHPARRPAAAALPGGLLQLAARDARQRAPDPARWPSASWWPRRPASRSWPTTWPALPWAPAFVLGAVLSPTDPIAAVRDRRRASARPRRLRDDRRGREPRQRRDRPDRSTSSPSRRRSGSGVTLLGAPATFVVNAVGGIAIGLVAAWLLARVRAPRGGRADRDRRLAPEPYLAYLPAEAAGVSAVLAAVTCGVVPGLALPRAGRARHPPAVLRDLGGRRLRASRRRSSCSSGCSLPTVVQRDRRRARWARCVARRRGRGRHGGRRALRVDVRGRRAAAAPARAAGPPTDPLGGGPASWPSPGCAAPCRVAAALAIPLQTDAGDAFPGRDLIIFLTYA